MRTPLKSTYCPRGRLVLTVCNYADAGPHYVCVHEILRFVNLGPAFVSMPLLA